MPVRMNMLTTWSVQKLDDDTISVVLMVSDKYNLVEEKTVIFALLLDCLCVD
jgi:hypothetical protein